MKQLVPAFVLSAIIAFAPSVMANPLFDGADPDILVENKKYWIYPTTEDKSKKEFFVYTSDDLHQWKKLGPILEAKNVSWIGSDGASSHELWAPGIFKKTTNTIYFTLSALRTLLQAELVWPCATLLTAPS